MHNAAIKVIAILILVPKKVLMTIFTCCFNRESSKGFIILI